MAVAVVGGFQMAKREGSITRIFFIRVLHFRVFGGLPFLEGRVHFILIRFFKFLPFFVRRVFNNVCLFSGVRAYRLFIKITRIII